MSYTASDQLTRCSVLADRAWRAADVNLLKVPEGMTDMQVILLSDILPTAWHATEMGQVGKGDKVAIWGAGPGANVCAQA